MEYNVIEGKQTEKLEESNIKDESVLESIRFEYKQMLREYNTKKAAGIASNQMGFKNRHCIVKDLSSSNPIHMINPKIVKFEGVTTQSLEGCLSWPKHYVLSNRRKTVVVTYLNEDLEEVTKTFNDYQAVIVQHELGHLDGVQEQLVPKSYRTVRNELKVGRNDICPCRSGKKYKKCCYLNRL